MSRPTALLDAELISIGTELTAGYTRDTNAGDLAAELTRRGLEVGRITALPDRLEVVSEAFRGALERAALVISTGGLGPTPDDLTREAIAAACGLSPMVDPGLERWLRHLFERRGAPMPEGNLKQAWLIPGAAALPNSNGTAPGWWVERGDQVIVALPGPPREMWPMWRDGVLPRLEARGLGQETAAVTLRLTGIGESALADLIGEPILRAADPEVATYARADAVEVRISSFGAGASVRVATMKARLEPQLEPWVFAQGEETWLDALGRYLAGRTLASVEIGTAGQLAALLGGAGWFVRGEVLPDGGRDARRDGPGVRRDGPGVARDGHDLRRECLRVREAASSDVGLAIRARERRQDTAVSIAMALNGRVTQRTRGAFLGGAEGRRRAALMACAELWRELAGPASKPGPPGA